MTSKARQKPKAYEDQRTVTDDDIEIANRIRMRRVELNMSQEELAHALGVTYQQIQRYEKGITRISGSRLLQVCRLFKVDPNYLFGWKGKPLKVDGRMDDLIDVRTAQAISALPEKVRVPLRALIKGMGEQAL